MLMILLSTLSVIGHLICGNNQRWLKNLNLVYKTLWTCAGIGFLISVLEKILFDRSNNTGGIEKYKKIGKMQKNNYLRCCACLSLLNWIVGLSLLLSMQLSY